MGARLASERGVSLLELLMALGLGLILVAGLLSLLRVHAEVARRQSLAMDLQQSLRIGRHELERFGRLAGRGGLPAAVAVVVRSQAAAGERIGGPGTPAVVPGSDVWIVRGVLHGPIADVASVVPLGPGRLALTLRRSGADVSRPRLEPLLAAALEPAGEALLLSAGPGSRRCAVVELVGGAEVARDEEGELTELTVETRAEGSEASADYARLSAACDAIEPDRIRRAGVLEEHRFYLRRSEGVAGRGARHRLSRARYVPGSDRVHPTSPSGGVTLIDHAFDLQVALGIDLDRNGEIAEASGDGRGADEWRYNDGRDPAAAAAWSGGEMKLVRVTLVLRAARPSRGHLAPPLRRIEDRRYDASAEPGGNRADRRFVHVRATSAVRIRGG